MIELHRQAHQRAVQILTTWQPPTDLQTQSREDFLGHLASHSDGLLKSCYPTHLTAGVLVTSLDRTSVLLNLHAKAQRWFAFGGHIETNDTDLVAAARREGTEESGITSLVVEPEPIHLSPHLVEFCDPRGPVTHLDVRFVARVDPSVTHTASTESLQLRWFSARALPTAEPDMVELINLACS